MSASDDESAARKERMAWVGDKATIRDAIDLHVDNLIGIYGKPDDRHALLRLKDGRMLEVRKGDGVRSGVVQAIDSDGVVLRYGSTTFRLSLPKT